MKGKEAKRRLALVQKAAADAESLYSMDRNDPPEVVFEILAICNGEACDECGDFRRVSSIPRKHYTHCSKYGEEL